MSEDSADDDSSERSWSSGEQSYDDSSERSYWSSGEQSFHDDSSERSYWSSSERSYWSSGERSFPEESTLILDCDGSGIMEVKNKHERRPMKSPGKAIGDSLVLRKLEIILSRSVEGGKYIGIDELFHGMSRNRSIKLLVINTNEGLVHSTECAFVEPKPEPKQDIFQALVPFFEQNDILARFDLHCSRAWILNALALTLPECKNTRLKRISLINTEASDEILARFFVSLCNVHSLTELRIKETRLGGMGGEGLANLLRHSNSNLRRLEICDTQLDDEHLVCLGNALAVNKTLKYLYLDMVEYGYSSIISISVEAWQGFSRCLRNPDSALKTLIFQDNNNDRDVTSEIVAAIARALEGNSTLKTLDIGCESGDCIFMNQFVWDLFDRVLCDRTSIAATFSSNHTLQDVQLYQYFRDPSEQPEKDFFDLGNMVNFCDLLYVNRKNDNKSEVARQKILLSHFAGGVTKIRIARGSTDISQVFCSAPDSVLVHAIEWIGRDSLGYSVMNDFVRGFPHLFGHRSGMQDAAERKRKRQDDNMPSNQ